MEKPQVIYVSWVRRPRRIIPGENLPPWKFDRAYGIQDGKKPRQRAHTRETRRKYHFP